MLDFEIIGSAAALGSAASWALGSVLFKMLADKIEPVALTFAQGLLGALMLGGVAMLFGFQSMTPDAFLLLTLSGLLGIAVGDTFFLRTAKLRRAYDRSAVHYRPSSDSVIGVCLAR
jgi:drug/metabolite transporter (DMT)-like permease